MLISFVIPIYNERGGLEDFFALLMPELAKVEGEQEIIIVDDGSEDGSLEVAQELAKRDKRIKVVRFSRNFGKEVALVAGLRESEGDAVIMMDADGQQPPSLIHQLIEKWKGGAEIVIGVRGRYEKHGLIAKIGSKMFYWLLRKMGVKNTVPGSTDYRLIDRVVVDEYNKLTEHGRITRGLMDWMGFKRAYVDYVYGNRLAGKPSYNFKKLFE